MGARRALLAALVAALAAAALAATALASGARSAALPAGASVAPASAPILVSVGTDLSSPQLQRAAALVQRFPGGPRLLQQAATELGKQGLDFERDVAPALGPEVSLVWLDLQAEGRRFVVLVRPQDPEKLAALLRVVNADAKRSQDRVHDIVFEDGWYAVGRTSRILAAYRDAVRSGQRLASLPQFGAALAAVPEDALGRVYVAGGAVSRALGPQAGAALRQAGVGLDWVAGALSAQESGVTVDLAARAPQAAAAQAAKPFKPTLTQLAPADAYAFATFRGGESVAQALRIRGVAQLLQALRTLGITPEDLSRLLSGEGAVWVRPGGPLIPEVTLVVDVPDASRELATVDRLARAIAGARPIREQRVGSVTAKVVDAGRVSIWWAAVDGRIVVTDRREGIVAAAGVSGPRLADDAAFRGAVAQSGLPELSTGFLYVDLARTIPYVERVATLQGRKVPPDLRANLGPLKTLLAYATGTGAQSSIRVSVGIG